MTDELTWLTPAEAVAADVIGDRITVTVRTSRSMSVLGFTGMGPVDVQATGTARAVQAVREEGD